jgi:uncharacterized protein Yka (UPF0111/DUF47 family)
MLKKIKKWILPKEIDFFGMLLNQSKHTQSILGELNQLYTEESSSDIKPLLESIRQVKNIRSENLKALNSSFITPIDREALSRAYSQLYWIVLSVKHLVVEIDTYKIYQLKEYEIIFKHLEEAISELTNGFEKLKEKKYQTIAENIDQVIHFDNKLIKAYAEILEKIFQEGEFPKLLMHKEILLQLREISKQIHICANILEDMIFKIN